MSIKMTGNKLKLNKVTLRRLGAGALRGVVAADGNTETCEWITMDCLTADCDTRERCRTNKDTWDLGCR